jgi:hypothetical protein
LARIDQYSRLKHHRISTSGQEFTIPTSEDHTDETWLSTDLYIGEIGVNITDDTMYFRTNNGIVQVATGTSSGGTSSASNIWQFQSPNIIIGSTYSADSVSPRSGQYTDLGTSTLRWKDLYLGGSSTTVGQIDINGSLVLKESANGILTTNGAVSSNAPIEINSFSSNANKDRPLFLNTRYGLVSGSSNYIVVASSNTVNTDDNAYVFVGAGNGVSFNNGVEYVTHFGRGYSRSVWKSDTTTVAGSLAVKGMGDDGSTQYEQSEWITSQSLLRTTNATTTDLVTIPWTSTASGGDVLQVKAYIIGTDIADAKKVYSAEMFGCYSIDGSLTVTEVGTPILNAQSSWSGTQPDLEMYADGSGFYLKATGIGATTIQWLCSFSYHKLINVIP